MAEKKNILVVDDEEDITLSIVNYLKKHIPDINILAAFDGDKALSILRSTDIDILITDIRMPGINGIDLLLELKKLRPNAKAIVVTAYGSEMIKRKSEDAGALYYVEKPFRLSHLCTMVRKMLEDEEGGFKGNISELELVDILQMLCMNKRSVVVDVRCNGRNGKIYIQNGDLIHCVCDRREGKDACFEILSWKNGEFSILPFPSPSDVKRTINESWMGIFMEGFKKIDEVNGNNVNGNNENSQIKQNIREIVNSVFQKVENLEINVIFNIEKKKIVFNGEMSEEDYPDKKFENYSRIISKLSDFVLDNEKEELTELVVILEESFLIFMRLSKHLVWCVKIRDTEKLGITKIVLEKCKAKLVKEIESAK